MCMDPVYMNCSQMVDIACGDDSDPHLKQSMLHCFLNILLEKLNLNSKCVELQPNQGNPVYDIFLYKLKSCEIKVINLSDFKPELEKKPEPCIQTVVEIESKKKCNCDASDLILPELDSQCVCELMERVRIQECQLNQLSERLSTFILEFRRKLPRKSQQIRDTTKDCSCKALKCNCEKRCKCGADDCNCIADSSTSSDADVECKVNDYTNNNNNNNNNTPNKNNKNNNNNNNNEKCIDDVYSFRLTDDILFDSNEKDSNIPKQCKKLCDPISNIACQLLMDPEFIKEVLKRVSGPLVDKIIKFQDQIYVLNKEFLTFLCKANHEYNKTPSISDCMNEIDKIHKILLEKDREFLCTLEEIQDMLDAKLDKWHIPSLKKFIRDTIDRIDNDIQEIKAIQDCPKGAVTLVKNVLCVCCNQPVCQKKILQQVPILPPLQASPLPKFTGKKGEAPSRCNPIERFCGGPHTTIQPTERLFKPSNLVDQFGKGKVLPEKIMFGRGIDGKIYRCEPPRPVCTCYENLMAGKKFPCSEHKSDVPPGSDKFDNQKPLTSPKKDDKDKGDKGTNIKPGSFKKDDIKKYDNSVVEK